ncbi:Fic family protein [Chitinophaga flava]|uniref:Cytochrome C biogenesis protein CycH n=1 Tax=Chitinophaga flava TaxID=2259036 RepID=A0A365XR20_9BACT|nr:Fic family protein [Chitinophaga flava]RBL88578.1 cytochrome C biogenesis protein CycH [Chitinophaga flava]
MFQLIAENTEKIFSYQHQEEQTFINVQSADNTIWFTQPQIAALFGESPAHIASLINNIYEESELDIHTTIRTSDEGATFYAIDVVISTSYLVKSPRSLQFRSWINKIIKDSLSNGGTSTEHQRLATNTGSVNTDEATGLLKVLSDYAYALDILDKYDHQQLTIQGTTSDTLFQISYTVAMNAIHGLKDKFGGSTLFGNEKDDSFRSSLAVIYQTFDGRELYPSIEEKAAHLLYFVVKNHSFSDGNKRIAAFLFVWFIDKNNLLYRIDGSKRIADNALVALTLMIAESKADEKEMMIKVVVNLINNLN